MKLEITQRGARMDGEEIPVGEIIEVEGDVMPDHLVNKAVIVSDKTAITNPAKGAVQQPVGYVVHDKGRGWFVVMKDGGEVTKSMRADDVEGFAAMSAEDQAAFVELNKADA